MSGFVKVAKVEEISPGKGKLVEAGGVQVALFNVNGTFYAIDNACTHAGGPLGEGTLEGDQVECPWHGAHFDVKTGEVLSAPAFEKVASYRVRVSGSDVEIEL